MGGKGRIILLKILNHFNILFAFSLYSMHSCHFISYIFLSCILCILLPFILASEINIGWTYLSCLLCWFQLHLLLFVLAIHRRRPPTHMYLTLSGMLKVQTNFNVDHLQHSISHPSWRKFQLKWYIMMSATSLVFYSMLSLPSTLPSTTKPHEQKVGKWGIIEKDFQRASQCSMPVVVGLAWVLWGVGDTDPGHQCCFCTVLL